MTFVCDAQVAVTSCGTISGTITSSGSGRLGYLVKSSFFVSDGAASNKIEHQTFLAEHTSALLGADADLIQNTRFLGRTGAKLSLRPPYFDSHVCGNVPPALKPLLANFLGQLIFWNEFDRATLNTSDAVPFVYVRLLASNYTHNHSIKLSGMQNAAVYRCRIPGDSQVQVALWFTKTFKYCPENCRFCREDSTDVTLSSVLKIYCMNKIDALGPRGDVHGSKTLRAPIVKLSTRLTFQICSN